MNSFFALALPALPRTPTAVISTQLVVILSLFAVMSFFGRKGWLRPKEVAWIGISMIFWAAAWLLQTTIQVTVSIFHAGPKAFALAGAVVAPVLISLSVALWFMVRRLKSDEPLLLEKASKKKSRTVASPQPAGPPPKPHGRRSGRRF